MHCLNVVTIIFLAVYSNAYINDETLSENFNNEAVIIAANSTNFQSTIVNNSTQVYDKLLAKISTYCISTQEFEELYGNKSKYGIVYMFAPILTSYAYSQMGQNEIRHHFNLKPQQINYIGTGQEEPENATQTEHFRNQMEYFQEKMNWLNKSPLLANKFWPDEIDVAEKFLDKKFPEARQIFQLKYQEEAGVNGQFNETTIDKMFVAFDDILGLITNSVNNMIAESTNGLIQIKKSRCYNKAA